jgi:hypothetical protein
MIGPLLIDVTKDLYSELAESIWLLIYLHLSNLAEALFPE